MTLAPVSLPPSTPTSEPPLGVVAVGVCEALSHEAWAVVWRGDGRGVKDFLWSFGLSGSAEEALAKVEARLSADPFFRRRWSGGVFYPLRIDLNVPVPRRTTR